MRGLSGLLVLSLLPPPAFGVTVTLAPARDNTLIESSTGGVSNGSGPSIFVGRNRGGVAHRALVAFDLAGSLPAGARIERVELRLFLSNAPDTTGTWTVALHRALAGWGEGASSAGGGAGAPSTPGDATWIHRVYPDSLWTSAGGDFDPAPSAALVVGTIGAYVWSDARMASDAQLWLDRPGLDFGWLLLGEEEQPWTARRFDSRENPILENRPALVVDYSPVSRVEPSTWGQVKMLLRQ